MINFEFLQFDQTNILFFVLSAVGLVRERRLLPFFIVALGNLIHGSLGAVCLSALILWHRMDLPAPKWVQLKDFFGFFLIAAAAVSTPPFQGLVVCLGVLFISLSFDAGGLGVIPALLLLRQFVPHPPELEALMAVAGVYWIAVEALRFAKSEKTGAIRAGIETLSSIGILYGLRDILFTWIEEPVFIGIGSFFLVSAVIMALILHFRETGFWSFYRKTKQNLGTALTIGNRFMSSRIPWEREADAENFVEIEASFDRLFILTILPLALLGLIWILSRGGLS